MRPRLTHFDLKKTQNTLNFWIGIANVAQSKNFNINDINVLVKEIFKLKLKLKKEIFIKTNESINLRTNININDILKKNQGNSNYNINNKYKSSQIESKDGCVIENLNNKGAINDNNNLINIENLTQKIEENK